MLLVAGYEPSEAIYISRRDVNVERVVDVHLVISCYCCYLSLSSLSCFRLKLLSIAYI
jgi:hypothetical protein